MVKWQSIAGLGTVSIFLLLAGLLNLSGMDYTVPPDIVCTDCWSQIPVNSTYWEVKAEHAGPDKDIMFKKMSRSRTLWVNLDRITEFVLTSPQIEVEILVPTVKRYATIKHPEFGYLRPIKDGDSLIARKNKYNPNGDRFVIHGKTGGRTIKWGLTLEDFLMEDIDFDPLWESPESCTFENQYTRMTVSPCVDYDWYGNFEQEWEIENKMVSQQCVNISFLFEKQITKTYVGKNSQETYYVQKSNWTNEPIWNESNQSWGDNFVNYPYDETHYRTIENDLTSSFNYAQINPANYGIDSTKEHSYYREVCLPGEKTISGRWNYQTTGSGKWDLVVWNDQITWLLDPRFNDSRYTHDFDDTVDINTTATTLNVDTANSRIELGSDFSTDISDYIHINESDSVLGLGSVTPVYFKNPVLSGAIQTYTCIFDITFNVEAFAIGDADASPKSIYNFGCNDTSGGSWKWYWNGAYRTHGNCARGKRYPYFGVTLFNGTGGNNFSIYNSTDGETWTMITRGSTLTGLGSGSGLGGLQNGFTGMELQNNSAGVDISKFYCWNNTINDRPSAYDTTARYLESTEINQLNESSGGTFSQVKLIQNCALPVGTGVSYGFSCDNHTSWEILQNDSYVSCDTNGQAFFFNTTLLGTSSTTPTCDDISFDFIYTPADTCSPSSPLSADHVFDCTDDCTLSSELDAAGNNVEIGGTGSFTTHVAIINANQIKTSGTCDVKCTTGDCFGLK